MNKREVQKILAGHSAWLAWFDTGLDGLPDGAPANFAHADISGMEIPGISGVLGGVNAHGQNTAAKGCAANFFAARAEKAQFSGVFSGTNFSRANLAEAKFSGEFYATNWHQACLRGADFSGSNLTDSYFGWWWDRVSKPEHPWSNTSHPTDKMSRLDLRNSKFDEATLVNAKMCGADCSGASFVNARLSGDFSCTRFSGARLTGAILSGNFRYCDFRNTDLRMVGLREAQLEGCDVRGAMLPPNVAIRGAITSDRDRGL